MDILNNVRKTFTMDRLTEDRLVHLAAVAFGLNMSEMVRYLINNFADKNVGKVIRWDNVPMTEVMGRDPLSGDTLLVLPSVALANGMVLDVQVRVPTMGMTSNDLQATLRINRDYINRLSSTLDRELGG